MEQETIYPLCDDSDCPLQGAEPGHTTNYARCIHFAIPEAPPKAFHPSQLRPGTRVVFLPDQTEFTLRERKDNGAGWWLDTDQVGAAPGVDDIVWTSTQQWAIFDETLENDEDEVASVTFDLDDIDPAEIEGMAALMFESNENRVKALEAKAGPGNEGSLANAFDSLRMVVFLEQIAASLGISALASLDFEGRRAETLSGIEKKYAEMLTAKRAAERAQQFAGGPIGRRGGIPQQPGPGGVVRPIGPA